jgi:hypothetical protein
MNGSAPGFLALLSGGEDEDILCFGNKWALRIKTIAHYEEPNAAASRKLDATTPQVKSRMIRFDIGFQA